MSSYTVSGAATGTFTKTFLNRNKRLDIYTLFINVSPFGAVEVELIYLDLILHHPGWLFGATPFIWSINILLKSSSQIQCLPILYCMSMKDRYRLVLNKYWMTYGGDWAMKDLITEIIQALVDHPEEVSVNEIRGSYTTVLELRVAKTDMGKVIGKQGRTAQAIRTILSAAAGKTRKRYILEVVE